MKLDHDQVELRRLQPVENALERLARGFRTLLQAEQRLRTALFPAPPTQSLEGLGERHDGVGDADRVVGDDGDDELLLLCSRGGG